MAQFLLVLNQVIVFVLLLAVGAFCRRIKLVNEESLYSLSQLTVKVALPAFIFVNTAFNTTKADLVMALPVLPAVVCLYIVLIIVSNLLEKVFHLKGNRKNVFRMCLMFGNSGLIGVPLVVEIYPENSLVYFGLITVIDMAIIWTYGVSLSYDTEGDSASAHRITPLQFLKMMLNPALVAVLLSIVFVLFGWKLPLPVTSALTKAGNLLSPLGLIYMGAMLNLKGIKEALCRAEIYTEIIVKMFVLPIIAFTVMSLIGLPKDMAGSFAVFAGLPSFMVSMMLAKNNGSDGDYAVGMVMMTTLACLVTYPLTSLVTSFLPG